MAQLQASHGNQAVLRMLGGPQPAAAATQELPAAVRSVMRVEGAPLERGARARAAHRVGTSTTAAGFGGVRVHTDALAADAARAVQARAFTVGQHIVFGAGEYQPHTATGRRLLAHELTHVAQGFGSARAVSRPDDAAEREADRAAAAVDTDVPLHVGAAPAAVVQRQPLLPGQVPDEGVALAQRASPLLASALGSATLQDFATGKADLSPNHRLQLVSVARNIAMLLPEYTLSSADVIGHADTVGTEANNLRLGQDRADVVKQALSDLGLPESMLTAESRGEAAPQAVETRDEVPNARNRRVDVVFHPRASRLTLMTGELTPPSKTVEPIKPVNLFPPMVSAPPDKEPRPDYFRPIPPPPRGSGPKSPLDAIGEQLDRIIDKVAGGLSKKSRDWLKEKARDGVKKGTGALVRTAAEQAGVTDKASLDALEKAAEAAIQEKGQRVEDGPR